MLIYHLTLQPMFFTCNSRTKHLSFVSLLIVMLACLFACKKDEFPGLPPIQVGAPNLEFYGLTNDNRIARFNAQLPEVALNTVSLSGLETGERILSIDFRPATGQLYGLSNRSRIFVIDPESGTSRAVSPEPFSPALDSEIATIDFNPTVDRIRLISGQGQNLRLNPETGRVVATDGDISGVANASVIAAAYTNNFAGASSTILYDIDLTTQALYKQDPPNEGALVKTGALGLDFSGAGGFDISPDNSAALAVLMAEGRSGLYSINLSTGKSTRLGYFVNSLHVIGIAIPTNPVAYAVDEANRLLIFNPAQPEPVARMMSGLPEGEQIVGLDMRPVNGQLYALSSRCQLYTVNAASGEVTALGSPLSQALAGTHFGFDFNPVVDRIRVVSDAGQNLRLNPNDGTLAAVDGMLQPGNPSVTGAAYTNNFAGTTSTVLYDLDVAAGKLFKQDPPNDGGLVEIGPLGIMADGANGFDIGGTSNIAYALLTVNGATAIYTINLQTGSATKVKDFPQPVRAMALGLGF
jgi:hypothetical protein